MDLDPALPVAVDNDPTRVRIDKFGVKHEEIERIFTEYDYGRLKDGYCCFECGEAQQLGGMPVAFPEKCSACSYPMRERQSRDMAEQFDGVAAELGGRPLEELRAEDDELKEKARRAREGRPSSMIWVPGA
jgi:hypothetical protein